MRGSALQQQQNLMTEKWLTENWNAAAIHPGRDSSG